MKFDVELGFISKLLQTKDILTVKDSHIKADFFTGDNRAAFEYIYDNVMETGEVPSGESTGFVEHCDEQFASLRGAGWTVGFRLSLYRLDRCALGLFLWEGGCGGA